MKNRILISAMILIIMIHLVNNLIGSTRINNNSKWIVPASVIDNDTIPVITFPAIIINGNENNLNKL